MQAAALLAKESDDVDNLADLLINLANLDGERGRYRRAETYLDSAYHLAEQRNNKATMAAVQNARAELSSLSGNFPDAYRYLRDYVDAREAYLDEERVRSVTEMMERYEAEKKARKIQQLELEKLDSELENQRITSGRNLLLYSGIVILLISIGLWNRLRLVRKSRSEVQREKDVSEKLLLNILPGPVAEELKEKGYANARHFKAASILFSDFKGFTAIAQQLTAQQLVEELNVYFKAFDDITTRYGIEKIKTIGDAYMTAGGIPDTNTAKTRDVVLAGLEMMSFVMKRITERADHASAFEMRIGIHTGPVVAGIVGVKKFQYDLWGDTVNIASRMQSTGAAGRVNISQDTYDQIKDDSAFKFTPRGKVEVKGRGEMEMFFVELA
jgi:class 3 adenylate cyclase